MDKEIILAEDRFIKVIDDKFLNQENSNISKNFDELLKHIEKNLNDLANARVNELDKEIELLIEETRFIKKLVLDKDISYKDRKQYYNDAKLIFSKIENLYIEKDKILENRDCELKRHASFSMVKSIATPGVLIALKFAEIALQIMLFNNSSMKKGQKQ